MLLGNASMPSRCTSHWSLNTRENHTSQNSRTTMPQRPKPTPTSRTRRGAIFIRASMQNGICCQLLVPNSFSSGGVALRAQVLGCLLDKSAALIGQGLGGGPVHFPELLELAGPGGQGRDLLTKVGPGSLELLAVSQEPALLGAALVQLAGQI